MSRFKSIIFISGNGSNLQNIIDNIKSDYLKMDIALVISNNSNAKGLAFAKKYKIKKKVFSFKNQKKDEDHILSSLKKNKISLICLAGFMRILSQNFIKKFEGKILNIHPSLLPKYKGLNTHFRAIKNKEKFSGCTIHFVNSKLDSGKIIIQKKVKIFKNDTPKTLANRILIQEHKLYPKAILKIFNL